ncbi:hypothetical protein Poli38472_014127 [Pythium oligandrum]|uniref:Chromo domain-containing protein n=1 Tax=Pythium oligandrum TaxID=41045 RepID=A0A8K1CQE3_PYTOL|nr:hypothetical protein Poli38472_014127 [Pythium oligandrum]|eukprot:TMW66815.1 hypothetical protein Poli38472_014127 [Pythium oligandrum]
MEPATNEQLMQQMVALIARQQEMLEKMQREQVRTEFKLEGVKLPTYSGRVEESAQLFYEQADQYFAAKGIAWKSVELAPRVLAALGGSLRGAAAQWFATRRVLIQSVDEFFTELHREFVPADLQQRLRDQLNALQQRDCRDLADYIAKHRQLMVQVRDMSEIDKVIYFQRGLKQRTREEVQYRRCETLSDAITVALDYDRAHQWQYRSEPRRYEEPRPSYLRNEHSQRAEPEPMEIDNVQRLSREDCRRRKLCFKCKKPGHSWRQCGSSKRSEPRRNQRRPVNNVEEDAVSEDEVILFDRVTTCNVQEKEETELIRKPAVIEGKPVTVLLDGGSNVNLIRPGLAKKVLGTRHVQLEAFDGSLQSQEVKKVQADVSMEGHVFKDQNFTEWNKMSEKHDVILGKPWHYEFQPNVNWRTNEVSFPINTEMAEATATNVVIDSVIDGDEFTQQMKKGVYEEVYKVKICAVVAKAAPDFVQPVLEEFSDVFPDTLPDELPPERSVNFELQMKEDAEPKSKGIYRLSKTEQDALEDFIQEKLRKGWIEVSNSPWVSNIFGVPKKDPATNTIPKRAEWLRSGNTKIPIRWVIDYRYVNSQTRVPQIPLPLIDELFDKMQGCSIFTVIDLAQGYHQIQEIPLVEYAKRFVDERKKLVELARKNLLAAQERQKQYYDKKRREVEFAEGDLVLLDTKNLPLRVAAEGAEEKKSKLAARRIGPFRIIKMINDNVAKLELPANLSRLHPTFNVELLTHYVPNPDKFETRPTSKAAPIIIDEETGEKTYVIEKLLEFRQVRRRREWLVKWEGYPEHECTWEPEKDLKHVSHWADLVEDFENRQREVKSGGMS